MNEMKNSIDGKYIKKKITECLVILFLFGVIVQASGNYWASKNSEKYHYPDCKYAKQINPKKSCDI